MNLLISTYKVPELIKENEYLGQIDSSKMKMGYSKMQRFMDDYWNIPVNQRAITPELMYKIKTVSTKFFPVNNR